MSLPQSRREPVPGKLVAIATIFLSITVASVLLTFVVIAALSAVRAYVAGENEWSKAQRDATLQLIRYGQTGDRDYYGRFEERLRVPLGDRDARLEMQKTVFDFDVAAAGLRAGGNHPDDIPLMIRLFRCCGELSYLQRIFEYWARGDDLILALQELGQALKAELESPYPSQIRIHALLEAVESNNDALHPLEIAFSSSLGELARLVSTLLMVFATAAVVMLLLLGKLLTERILRSIRVSEAQYRTLMQSAGAGLIVIDSVDGTVLEANLLAQQLVGRPAEAIVGKPYAELFAGPDPFRSGASGPRAAVLRGAGRDFHVELTDSRTSWRGREARLAILVDISERLRTERQLRIATNAIANMSEAVVITDDRFRIVSVNRAFTAITGFVADAVVGRRPELSRIRGEGIGARHVLRALRRDGRWSGELRGERRNGERYPQMLSLAGVSDDGQGTTHFIGIFTDNSAFRDYERRLRHLADHDILTELPNRATFEAECDHAMRIARATGGQLALLFVDLDGFKTINDTYGHATGDEVLRVVGSRIRRCLRKGDRVGRVGGDEFNVLLDGISAETDVTQVARTLLSVVAEPVHDGTQSVSLSASIGISLFPRDATDFDTLVSHADMAMYEAKARGRNNYQVFSAQVSIAVKIRQTLVSGLRQAIDRNQFQLYYQPHTDLATGQVLGFEALLRWQHPELGWVPPSQFITVAEDMGLIDAISDWVLRTACCQGVEWRAAGLGDIQIAVNLSPRNFWDRELPRRIESILSETGWPPSLLCLEITEGTIMGRDDPEDLLRRLRDLGIRLAIDDFGVGYSSLGNLRRFPVNVLKIDRSFTAGIPVDKDNLAMVRTILALARNLGLSVIAEGIETETQCETLIAEGCRQGQGYLFGKPMPADAVVPAFGPRLRSTATGDRHDVTDARFVEV